MKIQHLSIIFIVIMLPIILVVSYYLNLQKSTLTLQLLYDQKLLESTKEAMEAFEINTTEWNDTYSNLSDSKRRDVLASINTFITSMSSHLGIGGTAKENMLSYIPAIAFTLYDGYYVYAPQNVPKVAIQEGDNAGQANLTADGNVQYIDKNGNIVTSIDEADVEYKHTLTTYLPYSRKYTVSGKTYVIDYTLDNYIRIYSEDNIKAGNLVYFNSYTDVKSIQGTVKKPTIIYNGNKIEPEILTEQVIFGKNIAGSDNTKVTKTYKYIYDIQNEKYYYEEEGENTGQFFRVVNGEKRYLAKDVSVGEFGAKYRKVAMYVGDKKIDVYQLLNDKEDQENWYIDLDGNGTLDEKIVNNNDQIDGITGKKIYEKLGGLKRYEDCSAVNYYVDAYEFTTYAKDLGLNHLDINENNNPEDESSEFAKSKREVITENVQKTIDTFITQYSEKTDSQLGQIGTKNRLIQIKATDWDQILRNTSIITFFEGIPIGLKYYNSYAIAVSTTNNEFINKDEIYFTVERR